MPVFESCGSRLLTVEDVTVVPSLDCNMISGVVNLMGSIEWMVRMRIGIHVP